MTSAVSRKKLCGLLTLPQAEVLGPLYNRRNKLCSLNAQGQPEVGWCRCRDVGGVRDSHHSLTLRRLTAKGLIQSDVLFAGSASDKSLYVYRITKAGIDMWTEYLDYREHARIAHPKINHMLEKYAA